MPRKIFFICLPVGVGLLLLVSWLLISSGYLEHSPQEAKKTETSIATAQTLVQYNKDIETATHRKGPGKHSKKMEAGYLGSETCGECHPQQWQAWRQSHHDQSMQHANADTVLGDFNNAVYRIDEQESRFYKKDGGYFVSTPGPAGELADYQILYTFGIRPLQQYIVSFPKGKLQVLPIAWDTLKKEWFFLQASLNPQPGEWVYWTNGGMNWNSMCADCHSTNLARNFDSRQNSYNTTWSAIDVGCEACHGPASAHVERVKRGDIQPGQADTALDMHKAEDPQVLVDKCGRCHSRRQQLTGVFKHNSDELLDHYLPVVLRNDLYHSDGQILEEVFVYGSYLQSEMYQQQVSCINCHDPHSARLKAEGNKLCTACHSADNYDSASHHHHDTAAKALSAGAVETDGMQCVDCHMPGRLYMVNDFRRDHSFRVPRPDLSLEHGTPNACNDCHQEHDAKWAAQAINRWFGDKRRPHFSEVLSLASTHPQRALAPLLTLMNDASQPAIARASAAHLLAPLVNGEPVMAAMNNASTDVNPLLRTIAAQGLSSLPVTDKIKPLARLLDDPVRAVRIAAAAALLELSPEQLPRDLHASFITARAERQEALNINADLPFARHQMAMDYHQQGFPSRAEQAYLETLEIDEHFNAARLNLAQLYYQQSRLQEVEKLYLKVIEQEPAAHQAHYSLGLLMAEMGNMQAAQQSLQTAAQTGNSPRAWYNLAVLHHQQKEIQAAEKAYMKALETAPLDRDFLNGLISLYSQQQQWQKAEQVISKALVMDPGNRYLGQLKISIEQMQGKLPGKQESRLR